MDEPTTVLIYLARALRAKSGLPTRVVARGDSAGSIGMQVFTFRAGAWVEEPDGIDQINALPSPPQE